MAADKITIPDGEDGEITLPSKWDICLTCRGDGKHSQHLGAITQEDWDRDWDEDSREDYFRGFYDRTCEECHGTGKVRVVDEDKLSPELLKRWHAWQKDERDYRAQVEMERRMGA